MTKEVTFTIDGQPVSVPSDKTIFQACEMVGVEVPCFCYHPKLSVAGNCRMCLVDVKGSPKPVASCAMPVQEGLEVITTSEKVTKARKGVLEFLLINHPLDCPVCDQGGECDLQDITMAYGPSTSRFKENKRAVPNKPFGPLIKTEMNRCIHCMRCVRFANEIGGVPELGGLHRGEHTEIATTLDAMVTSEVSGNMIDICPVGALTAKPYAFTERPWELSHAHSIDLSDAVGSNIRVDYRGAQVMRIIPRENEALNECWLSDKARFCVDGLKRQRLDRPYVKKNGKVQSVSLDKAYATVAKLLKQFAADEIAFVAGDLVDLETLQAAKTFAQKMAINAVECRQEDTYLPNHALGDLLFNTHLENIQHADACLIVGANPRYDASMLNLKIRKQVVKGNMPVGLVGEPADLTYPYEHLGENINVLWDILSGQHPYSAILKAAKKPMVILGEDMLKAPNGAEIYGVVRGICEKFGCIQDQWNGMNVLWKDASRVGALALDFYMPHLSLRESLEKGKIKCLYLLGADDLDLSPYPDVKVIYQGHHGDRNAPRADVILPSPAFTEKEGTYINMEGRVQKAARAVVPLEGVKEDWRIFMDLAQHLDLTLPFDSLTTLQDLLHAENSHIQSEWVEADMSNVGAYAHSKEALSWPIKTAVRNFYFTNAICRSSETMAKCTQAYYDDEIKRAGVNA